MFDKVVIAVEPFAYMAVILAGLSLAGKFPIANNVILGFVVAGIGVALCVIHVKNQLKTETTSKSKKG